MEEQKLQDFKADFALLIEAGFVAVKQLDEVTATRIFAAAQMLSPKSTAPKIGLGYIALNKLETKQATKIFEEIIQEEPENYLALTFLGMCFLLNPSKRKKGEEFIKKAIEKTTDPTIKNLGLLSLEWADKDLKNIKKAPFFGGGDKEKTNVETENAEEKIEPETVGKKNENKKK